MLCQVDNEFYFNNSYKKQTAKILEIKPHDESKTFYSVCLGLIVADNMPTMLKKLTYSALIPHS